MDNFITQTANGTKGQSQMKSSLVNLVNGNASLSPKDETNHYPIKSTVYRMKTENTVNILQMLRDEMSKCPNNNIHLHFHEIASITGLNRSVEFKGKGEAQPKTKALIDFRSNFFFRLSLTDEFMTLDDSKAWNVKNGQSLDEIFTSSDKLYDINGNQARIDLPDDKATILILWQDTEKLKEVLMNINKSKRNIITISTDNNDFFKKKRYLHDNDLLNKALYYFEDYSDGNTAFDYSIDPCLMIINNEGVIKYDDAYGFNQYPTDYSHIIDLIEKGEEYFSETDINRIKANKVNEWWWALSNEAKEEYIETIHEKFDEIELYAIYLNIVSEIAFDNNGGIYKSVKPYVVGMLSKKAKNVFDNLIREIENEGNLEEIMINISYID